MTLTEIDAFFTFHLARKTLLLTEEVFRVRYNTALQLTQGKLESAAGGAAPTIAILRPCHLLNFVLSLMTQGQIRYPIFGNTLGRACPSRVRCPVFLPRDWHGGLGDDDFTIPIVPIRRSRMETAYDPRKLPTFDLYATGVPVGVLTGSPPMTPGSRKPSN